MIERFWVILEKVNQIAGKAMGVLVFVMVVFLIAMVAIPPKGEKRDKGFCIFLIIGAVLLLTVWFGTEPLLARIFL